MYFKTGTYYTGAIGTNGTSLTTANLSFFTQATENQNSLIERMTILNNGLVGIGTIMPAYPLTLKAAGIGFSQESTNGAVQIGFYTNTADAYVQTHTNVPMNFATNNGPAQMTLTTTGRIGINTLSPVSRLEVKGKTKITQQVGEDAALELNGGIKVSGTAPAAFVITTGDQDEYIIDHPSANGNPNAMIFVTNRSVGYSNELHGTFAVNYDTNIQKWKLVTTSPSLLNSFVYNLEHCDGTCWASSHGVPLAEEGHFYNQSFNVLIITN